MSKSSSKQSNTLFKYFSKSPKTPGTSDVNSNTTNGTPTSNKTPHRSSVTETPKEKTPSSTLKVKTAYSPPKTPKSGPGEHEGDLVWAKLDGYPWWPGLVCKHPTKKKIHHDGKIHVQFFDDPPSRSWIDSKCIKPYKGGKVTTSLGITNPFDPNWDRACRDADKAMGLSLEDRLALVTVTAPSDDEEEKPVAETPKLLKKGKTPTPDGKKKAKRRRIIIEDSDEDDVKNKVSANGKEEDDDYKPEKLESSSSEDSSGGEEVDSGEEEDEEESSPASTKKRKRKHGTGETKSKSKSNGNTSTFSTPPQTPRLQIAAKNKLAAFTSKDSPSVGNSPAVLDDNRNFSHLSYEFLKPGKLMDAKRRKPDHPEYDPRTLYLPDDFKNQLTPAMRQWWELKSKHFDVILFFKMGKFYELYHTDAVIAVKELGLLFMKGESAHCGFPEIAFGRYSSALIEKGYKVARVEQTETPDMMAERCKTMSRVTKFDKVVKRELCQITTKGTRTYNVIEGDCSHSGNDFLLAVTEKYSEEAGESTNFGVAFVDTSIGVFFIGQFEDDRYRSRFSTLLAHYNPVQILSEKRALSPQTLQLINNTCPGILHEMLNPETEFWEATKTLRFLAEGDYFKNEGSIVWPDALKKILDDSSSLGIIAKDEFNSAVRALGALCFYLTDCKLDQELLSRRTFKMYEPPDVRKSGRNLGRHMIVDGMTLRNLDILVNSALETTQGTLLERLDRCSTPFGQRLLRQWVCTPLCQTDAINDRLDAVEDLNDIAHFDEILKILKSLPDLERLLNKIHGQGSALRAKNHPDSRAVFFEEALYSKKKICDFLSALEGFTQASEIPDLFGTTTLRSGLLKRCVTLESKEGGQFPDMKEVLQFFKEGFDHAQAKKEGKIIPRPGVDPAYDEALQNIEEVNAEAEKYLQEQKKKFGCKITYVGSDKKRFQLEIPDTGAKKVDHSYEIQGQRKGFKKYITTETKDFLVRLLYAEDQRDAALKDVSRRIFEQFDGHRNMWEAAVNCLAVLDVLMALSLYSRNADGVICRPRIVQREQPYLRLVEGRHPCHSQMFVSGDFIPNDVTIGSPEDDNQTSLVLVTGPNMGGKSTLMRQVGVTVLMAQLGCFVPAAEFELTPVDRLFTRLGASDHILAGESTFFVELSETAAILKHATQDSLVLLDELGRGTATFDGTAIAYAVVEELCQLSCRTLFSTHYHSLVHDLADHPQIALGHMACMVENDDIDDPSEETIIFLYKFEKGPCPKSYGFHAARLAGLPQSIISRAYQRAKEMESSMNLIKTFHTLFTQPSVKSWQTIQWDEVNV